MTRGQLSCAVCGEPFLQAGGYYVSLLDVLSGVNFQIVSADGVYEPSNFPKHVCGKNCLMRLLTDSTDRLDNLVPVFSVR